MNRITIDLPDDTYSDLQDLSKQLAITPEECLELSLSLLFQTPEMVEISIIGVERYLDKQPLVTGQISPMDEILEEDEDEEEDSQIDLSFLKFHPQALVEFEELHSFEQIDLINSLASRLQANVDEDEEEEEGAVDLVLKDNDKDQLIFSLFEFGALVYSIDKETENLIIYTIHYMEEDDSEEEDDQDIELDIFDEDRESISIELDEYEEDDLPLQKQ